MERLLVTGAAGRIGSVLRAYEPPDEAEAFVERTGETLPYRFQGGEMAEP